ncbi:hypothetical protein MCEMIEM13_01027 [Comamonadaceae bacterium]
MKKKSFKGNHLNERFVAFPQSVLDAPSFFSLSGHAYKLLMDVASQYKGDNNGNLTAAWAVLKKRGWKSKTTLWRCKNELIEAGYLYVTRAGRLPNTCELLALTWFPLDVSPKFDPGALHGFEPKAYRPKAALPMPTIKPKTDWTLPNGGRDQVEKT